jgi:hypothetical protein
MPNEASLEHVISFKLDSSRAQGSATSVEFITDHPLYPVVSPSVIIPRKKSGGATCWAERDPNRGSP